MEIGIDDIVRYSGEYENCHDFDYKVIKVWLGGYYDLEMINFPGFRPGVYKILLSI